MGQIVDALVGHMESVPVQAHWSGHRGSSPGVQSLAEHGARPCRTSAAAEEVSALGTLGPLAAHCL